MESTWFLLRKRLKYLKCFQTVLVLSCCFWSYSLLHFSGVRLLIGLNSCFSHLLVRLSILRPLKSSLPASLLYCFDRGSHMACCVGASSGPAISSPRVTLFRCVAPLIVLFSGVIVVLTIILGKRWLALTLYLWCYLIGAAATIF